MRVRALIGATFLGGALLPALALVALADEDPPLRPADAGPPLRPPLTVLRAAVTAPPAPTPSIVALGSVGGPKRELIVLVGGLGSASDDETFKAFRERLAKENGYDVVRFGQDPAPTKRSVGSMRTRSVCATASGRHPPDTTACTS